MKASELVAQLQTLIATHGDLDIAHAAQCGSFEPYDVESCDESLGVFLIL